MKTKRREKIMIGKNILTVLLMMVFLVMVSSGALAFGSAAIRGRSIEKFIEKVTKELELTQPQKEKALASAKKIEEEAAEVRSKNRELFDKVEKELLKDSPDRKLLSNYMQQISQNNSRIQLKRMEQIIEFRKELTPKQKAKLEKLMKERSNKRKHDIIRRSKEGKS
jgi:Spy/CpxP family protein refolding chaperone